MTEPREETAGDGAGPAAGSREMLKDVRREVVALLAELPRSPTALRVEASGVVVEVAWGGETPAVAALSAPAPAVLSAQAPGTVAAGTVAAGTVAAGTVAAAPAEQEELYYVCAPTVGVFYRAAQPGAEPLVAEGDLVSAGDQVAIVEAMKLFLPVEADRDGRIVRFLVADGGSIEFGERLIALEEIA